MFIFHFGNDICKQKIAGQVLFLSFSSFEMLNLVFHKQTKRNIAFSQCNRGISFKGQNKKAQNEMASW